MTRYGWLLLLTITLAGVALLLSCGSDDADDDDADDDSLANGDDDDAIDDLDNQCPHYTGNDECCRSGDPCDLAENSACNCDGFCYWDFTDCKDELDYCPDYSGGDPCCQNGNPCGWDGDTACDCDGYCGWDSLDCTGVAPANVPDVFR